MSKKALPIIYNANYHTTIANDVLKGKQEMTLQEARIIRLVITQVAKDDTDLKTYTCNIQDLATFLGIADGNLYRDVQHICGNLVQRAVWVGTGNPKNPWKVLPWLQLAEYDGAGTITLMLSEAMRPYVLELDKYFTQYQLENILQMSSFYGIRMYELLKCNEYKNGEYQEYSIDFLRQYFSCEKKYSVFKDFRRRVLEVAIREINNKSDLYIDYIEYKITRRKTTSIKFAVFDNYDVMKNRKQLKEDNQLKLGMV